MAQLISASEIPLIKWRPQTERKSFTAFRPPARAAPHGPFSFLSSCLFTGSVNRMKLIYPFNSSTNLKIDKINV